MSRTEHPRRPRTERLALCRELLGKRVELTRDVTNGRDRFPAGLRMTVERTWRGRFSLCIGFASPLFVSDIGRYSFRVLDEQERTGVPCLRCHLTYGTRGDYTRQEESPCAICGKAVAA